MGKKSKRPTRNKPKGIPAAASPAAAAPRQVITSANDDVATFNQLCDSQDWSGMLELESKMSAMAKTFENDDPGQAVIMNLVLGHAHKVLGREGGIEKASVYFKKAIELAKKAGNNEILTKGVLSLARCYVEMGRAQGAMDLHKSLWDKIGKESMDPDDIVSFAKLLQANSENSHTIEFLEEHLDNIESSWDKRNQCEAYEIIARIYHGKNDFAKSNVYFERQLSIAKEMKDVESESFALHLLGHNYGRMGNYDNAMAYLEQALVIESERGGADGIPVTYTSMGDVLVAQGREKEAILMFQKCAGLVEEGNTSDELKRVFLKLGQAYTTIRAWDDAIASLEKGLSIADSVEDERLANEFKVAAKVYLGKVYLAKFYSTHESLVDIPARNDELIRKALFWSEAAFIYGIDTSVGTLELTCSLDLAQEYHLLGNSGRSHLLLKEYLNATLRLGPSYCQACEETCAKDAIIEKCSVCKVARYCSYGHSIQAWKKGRLCHKVVCPYLQRWRKIKPGKETTTALCDELCNDFFERVVASKAT